MKTLVKKPFYFVRHGRNDWNERELCQGFTAIPLNDSGCREISGACPFIQKLPFEKIVSSPLKQALQSAQIIQKACNKPLTIVDELKGRHWGDVECNPTPTQWGMKLHSTT
ncbi:MAG: histidine phosphatase family protein [Chlamydiia bacterium]|nr:histidine phosphatase family protein [Chlamydiia bacterium]